MFVLLCVLKKALIHKFTLRTQTTQTYDASVVLTSANAMGDYTYEPAEEFVDYNVRPEPGSLNIMVSGFLGDNFNPGWNKAVKYGPSKGWMDGKTPAKSVKSTFHFFFNFYFLYFYLYLKGTNP